MKEELTVIVPNYNKGKYLRECVESIERQSYKPREVIIVDDKSTDESRIIIEELACQYRNIRYIFLDQNGGVSQARNRGLAESTTEFVTFIDSDDFYFEKDKLKNEMQMLVQCENPYHSLTYSMIKYVDEKGNNISGKLKRQSLIYVYSKHPLSDLLSLKKIVMGPRDYCIAKRLLLDVGAYSYEKDLYEDLDLLMRLACAKVEFICTREWGTAYRQNTGGLSSVEVLEHKRVQREIIDKYWDEASWIEKIRVYNIKIFIGLYEEIRLLGRKLRLVKWLHMIFMRKGVKKL